MTKLGGASNQPTNPNLTGYQGDLKFPGREEVPTLDSNLERKLKRRF